MRFVEMLKHLVNTLSNMWARFLLEGVAPLREISLQACHHYQLKRLLERLPPLLVKEVEDAGRKFNTHKPIRLEHCFNY